MSAWSHPTSLPWSLSLDALQIAMICFIILSVAKVMDLEKALRSGHLIDDISLSVQKIIFANFPNLSAEESEDVDQEVKLKLWKMASNGKKIRNFRSYLWRVVYTTALDIIGKRLNGMFYEDHDNGASAWFSERLDLGSPERLMEKNELKSMVGMAVESLREKRRLVVKLYLTGMRIEETAEFVGWGENKVRHLLYRGLGDLKKALTEYKRPEGQAGLQPLALKKPLVLKESDE